MGNGEDDHGTEDVQGVEGSQGHHQVVEMSLQIDKQLDK